MCKCHREDGNGMYKKIQTMFNIKQVKFSQFSSFSSLPDRVSKSIMKISLIPSLPLVLSVDQYTDIYSGVYLTINLFFSSIKHKYRVHSIHRDTYIHSSWDLQLFTTQLGSVYDIRLIVEICLYYSLHSWDLFILFTAQSGSVYIIHDIVGICLNYSQHSWDMFILFTTQLGSV